MGLPRASDTRRVRSEIKQMARSNWPGRAILRSMCLRAEHYDTIVHRYFAPERALSSPNAGMPARFKSTGNLRRHTSREGPDLHIPRHQAHLRLGGVSAYRGRHLPCSPRSFLSWTGGANAARQVIRARSRGGAARPRRTRASPTACVVPPAARRERPRLVPSPALIAPASSVLSNSSADYHPCP